jgi:hypothetical protein
MNTASQGARNDSMDRWLKRNRTVYALIAAVGLMVIATMSYGFNKGIHIYKLHYPWVIASTEIRIEVTTASLRFEEILGGNTTKTISNVWNHMDIARSYADAILNGAQSGHVMLYPLDEAQLRASITALREQLQALRHMAEKRLALHEKAVDPDMDINRAYYKLLDDFIKGAVLFESRIKGVMQHDYGHFYTGLFVITVFCALLFVFSGLIYHRFEGLKQNADHVLQRSDPMLTRYEMKVTFHENRKRQSFSLRHELYSFELTGLGSIASN